MIKKVREVIGERFSFASVEDLTSLTDCIPGSVPPFGTLFGPETRCDKTVSENETIYFNAGTPNHTIQLKFSDYLSVENPTIVDVSE